MASSKLPALKIFKAGFVKSPQIIKSMFTVFWPVIILGLVASYFTLLSSTTNNSMGAIPASQFYSLALWFFFYVAMILVNLCWIEHVVKKQPPILNFDARVPTAFFYGLIVLFLVYAPIILIFIGFTLVIIEGEMNSWILFVIPVILSIIWIVTTMRFSLVIPAIALNNRNTRLGRSWSLTKGYQTKIFLLMCLPLICIQVPINLIQSMLGIIIFDSISYMIVLFVIIIMSMYGAMIISEITARLFIFFHAPEKLDEYL